MQYILLFVPTCSGDTDGSVGGSIEEEDDVSEPSSISGSRVLLGSKPLMTAPLMGGVMRSSSIIISVSSPKSEERDPSFG